MAIVLSQLINFIFPKRCLGCKQSGSYLCQRCIGNIAQAEPLDVSNAMACYHYHDPLIKRALQMLKYKQQFSIAGDLAQSIYDRLLEELSESDTFLHRTEPFVLVPVPLSRERRHTRGYNQAEVLAQELKKLSPELFEINSKALKKIKDTPSQVSVRDRAKRLENLRGAFQLTSPADIKNRVVIVIDDVITTGATITEVTKVLKEGAPRMVYALSVAHG
jgi:competence protein ComFC